MTPIDVAPLLVAASFGLLSWGYRRLRFAAQPLRLELATKGEALLLESNVPENIRQSVTFMLDTAFSLKGALFFSIIFLPFFLVYIMFTRVKLNEVARDISLLSEVQRAKYYEIMKLHDKVTLANNPFLSLFFGLEFTILVPLFAIIITMFRGYMPQRLDREVVVNVLERNNFMVIPFVGAH
jgi:hypothetical protein